MHADRLFGKRPWRQALCAGLVAAAMLASACGGQDGADGKGAGGGAAGGASGADGAGSVGVVTESAAPYALSGGYDAVYTDPKNPFNMFMFDFSDDGRCRLSLAIYASDVTGCTYYGEYAWGGADGRELTLDLYHGKYTLKESEMGTYEEYYDPGRSGAEAFTTVRLHATFGAARSILLESAEDFVSGKADGTGETELVIGKGAFLALSPAGDTSAPRYFGVYPWDGNVVPDAFLPGAEEALTTAELNVRAGPGIDYDSFGKVPEGTRVDRIAAKSEDAEGEWAFCLFDQGAGWMSTDYLAAPGAQDPAQDSTQDPAQAPSQGQAPDPAQEPAQGQA